LKRDVSKTTIGALVLDKLRTTPSPATLPPTTTTGQALSCEESESEDDLRIQAPGSVDERRFKPRLSHSLVTGNLAQGIRHFLSLFAKSRGLVNSARRD
jgi:hypothetical protein